MKTYKRLLMFAACAIVLTACATGGINTTSPRFWVDFSQGNIRLTCGLACAGTSGANLRKETGLYQARMWKELAREVSSVGFEGDREYFFLGAAAESLGYREAAKIYYQLSLATTFKCKGNMCSGLVLPRDAIQRLNYITAQEEAEKRARVAKSSPKANTSNANSSSGGSKQQPPQAVALPQVVAPPPSSANSSNEDSTAQQGSSSQRNKKSTKSDNSI